VPEPFTAGDGILGQVAWQGKPRLVALEFVSILDEAGVEVVGPINLVEEAIETIASERLDLAESTQTELARRWC